LEAADFKRRFGLSFRFVRHQQLQGLFHGRDFIDSGKAQFDRPFSLDKSCYISVVCTINPEALAGHGRSSMPRAGKTRHRHSFVEDFNVSLAPSIRRGS
jgi:hypothetical protein